MKKVTVWDPSDVLAAVSCYRHRVGGLYGPPSYAELSATIGSLHDVPGPGKATLSLLVNSLIEKGKLAGERDPAGRVVTATLHIP